MHGWAGAAVLHDDLSQMEGRRLLPAHPQHVHLLQGAYLLEKRGRQLAQGAAARRREARIPARAMLDTRR